MLFIPNCAVLIHIEILSDVHIIYDDSMWMPDFEAYINCTFSSYEYAISPHHLNFQKPGSNSMIYPWLTYMILEESDKKYGVGFALKVTKPELPKQWISFRIRPMIDFLINTLFQKGFIHEIHIGHLFT